MSQVEENFLTEKYLHFESQVTDWQEAIRIAAAPLLADRIIEESYITAMIDNVTSFGDYMVLVPKVAMPHARPEAGAHQTGFSILKLDRPVVFGETPDVYLIICLATNNNEAHLALLQKLSALIDDEEKVTALLATTTKAAFLTLAEAYILEEEADND